MDSTALALLGENRADYGRYRVGGTFGFIVTTLTVGFIFERIGLVWMFPFFSLIMVLFIIAALRLPQMPVRVLRADRSSAAILRMVRQPGWLVFAVTVFIVWFAGSGAISFVSVTLRGMGANDSLIGLVACSAAVFEVPFMVYNRTLLRKLGSRKMLWISTIGYILRIGGYSLMKAPAWGIAINAFNGISYVFLWNAGIQFTNENAPEDLKATAQGLFVSTTALAGVASSVTSGWLFDTLGPPGLFRVLAVICFSATIIFGIWGRKPIKPVEVAGEGAYVGSN
jgi:PPP family 3-phenylpropionic acid transporter